MRHIEGMHKIAPYAKKLVGYEGRVQMDKLVVEVDSLEGFQELRHYLRERLGAWHDRKTYVFCCFERVHFCYENTDGHPIQIELVMKEDRIPDEFKKDGCRLVETQTIEKQWVCGIGEKHE
jgi:hypothetical protein